jgi:hypothetical protein
MVTLEVTVTFDESLLVSVTVTPVGGAGAGSVMANGMDWLRPRLTFDGKEIAPPLTAFTVAVESAMFGSELA